MGAINYGRNDYVNLGFDLSRSWETDEEMWEEVEWAVEDVQWCLDNKDFEYFKISVDSGYYEGFYLEIEENFPDYFDDYLEKRQAQKEITKIKQQLLGFAEYTHLVNYTPNWVTSYYSYSETVQAINEGIKKMREEVKSWPTYVQWIKEYK